MVLNIFKNPNPVTSPIILYKRSGAYGQLQTPRVVEHPKLWEVGDPQRTPGVLSPQRPSQTQISLEATDNVSNTKHIKMNDPNDSKRLKMVEKIKNTINKSKKS